MKILPGDPHPIRYHTLELFELDQDLIFYVETMAFLQNLINLNWYHSVAYKIILKIKLFLSIKQRNTIDSRN